MRRALTEARKNVETVSTQNRRMSSLLKAVRLEQQLLDNGAAVCMLQGEVRRGLEAVTTA